MKVTICIPFGGFVTSTQFTVSLSQMVVYSTSYGIEINKILTTERNMVHWARQALAEAALKTDSSHFLWLDDDHTFLPDALVRLSKHSDKDIVTALACEKRTRQPIVPYLKGVEEEEGVAYDRYELPNPLDVPKKLVKCDGIGFGFALIKKEVFKAIKPPYFRFIGNEGEDSYFSSKATKAGFSCFVDGETVIGHLGQPLAVYPMKPED